MKKLAPPCHCLASAPIHFNASPNGWQCIQSCWAIFPHGKALYGCFACSSVSENPTSSEGWEIHYRGHWSGPTVDVAGIMLLSHCSIGQWQFMMFNDVPRSLYLVQEVTKLQTKHRAELRKSSKQHKLGDLLDGWNQGLPKGRRTG